MKTLFIRLLCLGALASVGLSTATAQEEKAKDAAKASTKAPATKKAKAKSDTYPLWGEVVAVTSRTLTIKGGEGKEDRKFTISAETKIHNDGKPATLEDIKVGKKVGGSVQKAADGNPKMLSINVGAAQEKAKAKKSDAKKAEGSEKAKSDKKTAE
jgi:hypothetical protein